MPIQNQSLSPAETASPPRSSQSKHYPNASMFRRVHPAPDDWSCVSTPETLHMLHRPETEYPTPNAAPTANITRNCYRGPAAPLRGDNRHASAERETPPRQS